MLLYDSEPLKFCPPAKANRKAVSLAGRYWPAVTYCRTGDQIKLYCLSQDPKMQDRKIEIRCTLVVARTLYNFFLKFYSRDSVMKAVALQ